MYVTADTIISDVINNPAFSGFGQFIFPIKGCPDYDQNIRIHDITSLLPFHSCINSNITVNVINYMLNEVNNGNKIFYNFYTDLQKSNDDTKENTGLFFFKGNKNAPFAVICAGGGFKYVASIHESFPIAFELSKKGYNAFTLEYRTGNENLAIEDLAAALSYIFTNAEIFNINLNNYSLWGCSAGGKIAANISSYGVGKFGGTDIPQPSIVVLAYKGLSNLTELKLPLFIITSENDEIVDYSKVNKCISLMINNGIDIKHYECKNVKHGFGLGIGTDAEGWVNSAIQFWKKYIV